MLVKLLQWKPYQEKLQHEQEISLCVVSHRRVVVVCNYSKAYSVLKYCEWIHPFIHLSNRFSSPVIIRFWEHSTKKTYKFCVELTLKKRNLFLMFLTQQRIRDWDKCNGWNWLYIMIEEEWTDRDWNRYCV